MKIRVFYLSYCAHCMSYPGNENQKDEKKFQFTEKISFLQTIDYLDYYYFRLLLPSK